MVLTLSMTCCNLSLYLAFSCSMNKSLIGPVTEFGGESCKTNFLMRSRINQWELFGHFPLK